MRARLLQFSPTTSPFSSRRTISCGQAIFHLEGEFSLYEIERLKKALLQDNLADHETVIVGLSHVRFIDSAGLECLVLLHRELAARGASLWIVFPDVELR